MPFMILKDSITFQNTERMEFPQHMWMNVIQLTVDDGVIEQAPGLDFRPCTVDDFDGDQAQYDKLSKGLTFSMFCPQDTSAFKMLNLMNQAKKSIGVFLDVVTCLDDKLPDGTNCITDRTLNEEFYSSIFMELFLKR